MIKELSDFWAEFHEVTESSSSLDLVKTSTFYRGVSDSSFKLIPSIAREKTMEEVRSLELKMMHEFKRLSAPLITQSQFSSDLELLFLAQHYGLPTRLLDWTTNPLVALFFAVEKDDQKEGALHTKIASLKEINSSDDYKATLNTPISLSRRAPMGKVRYDYFVRPSYLDLRYASQKSVFSYSTVPTEEIESDYIIKISPDLKQPIRDFLKGVGFSHSSIYPGLEGISREIKNHVFLNNEL